MSADYPPKPPASIADKVRATDITFSERIAWASECPAPVSSIEWSVLQVLAWFADRRTLECWPSHKTIQSRTRLARPTVKKALDGLVELGCIERQRGRGQRGGYRYRLTPSVEEIEAIRNNERRRDSEWIDESLTFVRSWPATG